MKQLLTILLLLAFVFCALATSKKKKCPTMPCPDGISDVGHCPDEGCGPPDKENPVDPELNRLKNISSDNRPSELQTIKWMKKDLPRIRRSELTECGSRQKLKDAGEGKKITVVAWAVTARPGSAESANCKLGDPSNADNHIVLFDPDVLPPPLTPETERDSMTAEFTPRVRHIIRTIVCDGQLAGNIGSWIAEDQRLISRRSLT